MLEQRRANCNSRTACVSSGLLLRLYIHIAPCERTHKIENFQLLFSYKISNSNCQDFQGLPLTAHDVLKM